MLNHQRDSQFRAFVIRGTVQNVQYINTAIRFKLTKNTRSCETRWWFSVVFSPKLSLDFTDIFRLPIPLQQKFPLFKCKSGIFYYYLQLATEK